MYFQTHTEKPRLEYYLTIKYKLSISLPYNQITNYPHHKDNYTA